MKSHNASCGSTTEMDDLTAKAEKGNNRLYEILNMHVGALAEHFDTVQVFCTKKCDGSRGTIRFHEGAGNYYARFGQARQWIIREEELTRREAET